MTPRHCAAVHLPGRLYLLLLVAGIFVTNLIAQSMRGEASRPRDEVNEPLLDPKHKQTEVPSTQPPNATATPPSNTTLSMHSTGLIESGHFDQIAAAYLVRAYPERTDANTTICTLQPLERTRSKGDFVFRDPVQGIFYNKVPKAASSTLSGINERIAIHLGRRVYGSFANVSSTIMSTTCTHKEHHLIGADRHYGNRLLERSFLWGSIRDPASRAISRVYFYQISQAGHPDDDEVILDFLKRAYNPQSGTISKGKGGFQLSYLTMDPPLDEWYSWHIRNPTLIKRPGVIQERVRNVTHKYDFLAVTERMDESVVVLQLLLGIRVGDVLSASSAKVGGAYYFKGEPDRCIPIQKSKRSPAVQAYLKSDRWYAVNYGDYLLYAAANHSLDMTIERLGSDRFNRALQIYRNAQRIIEEECRSETFLPCSANGTVQIELSKANCYRDDAGCGHLCIDRIVRERGW